MLWGKKLTNLLAASTIVLSLATVSSHAENKSLLKCFTDSVSEKVKSIPSLAKQLREANRKYWREMRETRGKRFFIKDRDQTPLHGWKFTASLFNNPFATVFNRPRELTIPVTTVGWIAAGVTGDAVVNYFSDKALQAAAPLAPYVPGGPYVLKLQKNGAIDSDTAASAIIDHKDVLKKWAADTTGEKFLPRTSDFVDEGILKSDELQAFNKICHDVFNQSLAHSADPNHFTESLITGLQAALSAPNSPFRNKSSDDLSILQTAFWPELKIGKDSDVRLTKELFSPDHKELAPVRDLLNQGVPIEDSLQMSEQILRHPSDIEKKVEKARAFVPSEHLKTFQRPDIPSLSQAEEFALGPSGKSLELSNESDRWKLLLQDPRFNDLAEPWKTSQISDVDALQAINSRVEAMNQIEKVAELSKKGKKAEAEAYALQAFGMIAAPGEKPEVNQLLIDTRNDINQAIPSNASDTAVSRCLTNATLFWADLLTQEAYWTHQSVQQFEESRLANAPQRNSKYSAILAQCKSAK